MFISESLHGTIYQVMCTVLLQRNVKSKDHDQKQVEDFKKIIDSTLNQH